MDSLLSGPPPISPFVAGIDDFDPEGNGIEVAFDLPTRNPRLKGSPVLGNYPPDHAVFLDNIMCDDTSVGIDQPLQRISCTRNACIIAHNLVIPPMY